MVSNGVLMVSVSLFLSSNFTLRRRCMMVVIWCRRRYHMTCSQRQFVEFRLGTLWQRCRWRFGNVHATSSRLSYHVRNMRLGAAIDRPALKYRRRAKRGSSSDYQRQWRWQSSLIILTAIVPSWPGTRMWHPRLRPPPFWDSSYHPEQDNFIPAFSLFSFVKFGTFRPNWPFHALTRL